MVLSIKFTISNTDLIMVTNKEVYYAKLNKTNNMKISKVTGWKG